MAWANFASAKRGQKGGMGVKFNHDLRDTQVLELLLHTLVLESRTIQSNCLVFNEVPMYCT